MSDSLTNDTALTERVTRYVVLRCDTRKTSDDSTEGTLAWRIENSNVPAKSAEAAIRLACKTDNTPEGTYVAVPARSWKPVQVRAEQQVILKLEQPT